MGGTSMYPPRLPQSLFERQGLPGPEKLPGSLRKGIPRTKSVGTAGLGFARGPGGNGAGWTQGWRTLSLHLQLGFQFPSESCLSLAPAQGSHMWTYFGGWGRSVLQQTQRYFTKTDP